LKNWKKFSIIYVEKNTKEKKIMKPIFEGITRKIDGTGRVILPKNLRNKYRLLEGDNVDYYTVNIDGKDYICIAAAEQATEVKSDNQ
jgi:bifunctional DNA-binding transcriptional regulator/antitoxin component of YhaV-PrlF toxin-antitoxin module